MDRALHAGNAAAGVVTATWIETLARSLALLPLPPSEKWPEGEPFRTLFQGGGAEILIFAPRGTDHQTPHDRDEVYVVVAGSATLEADGDRRAMTAGDIAWVPRSMVHRFVDISADFATWVIFVGPSSSP
jgi:mannose-6-phosphate isomerase-like protein (cupin superfamily)